MNKLYLGIHLNHFTSILDALKETKNLGLNVLQIYMGSKILTTLREKIYLDKDQIKEIKNFIKLNKIKLFIHSILRLNYCYDPYQKKYEWGLNNLIYDMNICNQLGGSGVVLHMNSHKTLKINISYEECIKNFIHSLTIVLDNTKKIPILLETPVNRKHIICGTVERLASFFNSIPIKYINRIKICIDTQHIFASGYQIKDYFEKFDQQIGIKNIKLIHLNDSKKEFKSLVNRHESIGKGFIFMDDKESLKYLLDYGLQNNIPFVLETGYKNYKHDIHLLRNLIMDGGMKNIKKLILKIFHEILFFHESLGKKGNISTIYRIDSYKKAIKSIENYDKPIYNCNTIKNLEFIGKGMCEKINEIANTGTLKIYEDIKKSHLKSFKLFQNIWGIGPEFSQKLVANNIFTLKDLKKAIIDKKVILTEQQILGLKYYNHLKKKIPRDEVKEYTNVVKKLIENDNIKVYNAGSYRMGKKESGDIDLIISFKKQENNIFDKLSKVIIETLSNGINKSIFIVKLNNYSYYRKMDISYIDEKYLPFYLLYFGSGREFSKKIRNIASKMGYKLNEKGLFDKYNKKRINFNPKNEEEIFEYLKLDYIPPEKR